MKKYTILILFFPFFLYSLSFCAQTEKGNFSFGLSSSFGLNKDLIRNRNSNLFNASPSFGYFVGNNLLFETGFSFQDSKSEVSNGEIKSNSFALNLGLKGYFGAKSFKGFAGGGIRFLGSSFSSPFSDILEESGDFAIDLKVGGACFFHKNTSLEFAYNIVPFGFENSVAFNQFSPNISFSLRRTINRDSYRNKETFSALDLLKAGVLRPQFIGSFRMSEFGSFANSSYYFRPDVECFIFDKIFIGGNFQLSGSQGRSIFSPKFRTYGAGVKGGVYQAFTKNFIGQYTFSGNFSSRESFSRSRDLFLKSRDFSFSAETGINYFFGRHKIYPYIKAEFVERKETETGILNPTFSNVFGGINYEWFLAKNFSLGANFLYQPRNIDYLLFLNNATQLIEFQKRENRLYNFNLTVNWYIPSE